MVIKSAIQCHQKYIGMIFGEICLIIFRYYVHNVHKAFCNDFSSSELAFTLNI